MLSLAGCSPARCRPEACSWRSAATASRSSRRFIPGYRFSHPWSWSDKLDAARVDPEGFIRGLDRAIVDEVQRVPELLLAIKKSVDEDYRPGRFLLTGSANVLTLPRVADSLAGRMETIRLLPLAQAEILGRKSSFLEGLFAGNLPKPDHKAVGDELMAVVLGGGYPEAIGRASERRRQDWIRSYLVSVLTRDLRDIAEIERLTDLPKFARLLAEHSGQLVNYSVFGSGINVNYKTSQRYVGLLDQVFLVATLQPWYTNAIRRVIKTPKLHFLDSGVLAVSRGLTSARVKADRTAFGALLESFAFGEVMKLLSWSDLRLAPFHFRDQEGHEVDIVLEREDGAIAGIEVKANATVITGDFSGLRKLADAAGKRFAFGVVLYDSDTIVPFGERLAAAPRSRSSSSSAERRPPALVMVALVAFGFMEIAAAPPAAHLFAVAGLLWLAILLGLGTVDPLTRTDYPVQAWRAQ